VKIILIAVGSRTPAWVKQGFLDYARRLPRHCSLELVEVPAVSRKHGDLGKIRREEGKRLLDRIPRGCHVVALSEDGIDISTKMLADALAGWMGQGSDVALLVGGADGMSEACRERANSCWSLSSLTFPHALVRVIVAEQFFRAWSMLSNHPYHRG
jgi:23S rRNA (pseudouridine1915-N3)-methyltransferase